MIDIRLKSLTVFCTSLLLLVLPLTGCDLLESGGSPDEFERQQLDRDLTDAEKQIMEGTGKLGFDLLQALQNEEDHGNILISPFSIQTAFSMVLNGADGDTYTQMQDVMGMEGLDSEVVNTSLADLNDLLIPFDENVRFAPANAVWYDDTRTIQTGFQDAVENHFDGTVQAADFANNPDAVRDEVNTWVADQTEDRIDEMLDTVAPDLAMLLVNAFYFDAEWTVPFDAADTEDRPFTRADSSTVDVPTMQMEEGEATDLDVIGYAEDDTYEAVSIYYGDAGFNMTLVRPNDGVALSDWIADMEWNAWTALTDDLNYQTKVTLSLPQFEKEYDVKQFGHQMKSLGMTDAFSEQEASFPGLFEGPESFFIDTGSTKHKTFIRVDEEGTEAAPATSIGAAPVSAPESATVNLDRPFFYMIREADSEAPLFIGTVSDPSELALN